MFKAVDIDEKLEGYLYTNFSGYKDLIRTNALSVSITDDRGETVNNFRYEDLPNLIRALQLAHEGWKK